MSRGEVQNVQPANGGGEPGASGPASAELVLAALGQPVAVVDEELRVVTANPVFLDTFQLSPAEVQGQRLDRLGGGSLTSPALRKLLTDRLSEAGVGAEIELEADLPGRGRRTLLVNARSLPSRARGGPAVLVQLEDVTDRQRHLGEALRLRTAAMESAANAIFITDRQGAIEWVNPAFERLTGYSGDEARGANPRIFGSGQQDEGFYREFWKTILAGRPWSGRVVNRHKDGHLFTVEQTVTPITDDRGEVTHFVAIHEDVTAQIESERQIAHMARHDFLTDLPNRYYLEERLALEMARADRVGREVAVLWIDIDNFKDVNDTFGHAVGDGLLVEFGKRAKQILREVDLVGRLGGDEFAIILGDLEDRRSAAELAARLVRSFADPFEIESQRIYITVSIGISVHSSSGKDKSELLKQADLALYRAKEDGRNTFRFFSRDMDLEIQSRMALGQDLHRALENDELFVEYQPQVELRTRRIVGVEALLRWRHPQYGLIPPTDFIPIAESSGLIVRIGEWVLRTACEQAIRWRQDELPALPMAVNLSAVQLRDPELPSTVAGILEQTGLEPGLLELELTETVLTKMTEATERSLWSLRKLGVGISLDDFGSGYASLDYLRRYPLSKVKIDRSFVEDMETNLKNATIVTAIIALAAKLDLQVIAEGVEPASVLQRLINEGCAEVQGFYFSRPVPPDELARLIKAGSDRIRPGSEP